MDQAETQTTCHKEAKPARQGGADPARSLSAPKQIGSKGKGKAKSPSLYGTSTSKKSQTRNSAKQKAEVSSDSPSDAEEDAGDISSQSALGDNGDSDSDSESDDQDAAGKSRRTAANRSVKERKRHKFRKNRSRAKRSVEQRGSVSYSESPGYSGSDSEREHGEVAMRRRSRRHEDELRQEILALRNQVALLQEQQSPLYGSYGPASGIPPNPYYSVMNPAAGMLNNMPGQSPLGNPDLSLPIIGRGRNHRQLDIADVRGSPKKTAVDNVHPGQSGGGLGGLEKKSKLKKKGPMRPEFKRVDWVWDTSSYQFRLQDSAEVTSDSQYDEYVFHVRRLFDVEGKYRKTCIDVKSKLLRECLHDVMGNVQGVSLVDETPKLDPNLLFLYLEDLRVHLKKLKELEPAGDSRKERQKNQQRLDDKRKHLKVLIKYLDHDYANVKASLNPMLQNGLITFELLWALWKPGTLAYSSTYGNNDLPHVFKVEGAERHSSLTKGEFYFVDGKYFEFDGKRFGLGSVAEEVLEFNGARKITSLPCYPLSYCTDEAAVREKLIARGKNFVALSGMHYRAYTGMAYLRRRKGVIRYNIQNSRIMIDPATFRRINPNYYVSHVRANDHDIVSSVPSSEEEDQGGGDGDSSDNDDDPVKLVTKTIKDKDGNVHLVRMVNPRLGGEGKGQKLEDLSSKVGNPEVSGRKVAAVNGIQGKDTEHKKDGKENGVTVNSNEDGKSEDQNSETQEGDDGSDASAPALTDEEYLIASPIVLGFSFAEKQWLEFAVSDIQDIKWNDQAWASLVLDPETKDLIRALVESRKFQAAAKIDDVIQGKGKGLVTVLHGPPGVGKTLTAEGISELLKCPLYMVSAGELGTDSRFLEHELQKILDICHTWGAILLLDEADVFLEKRNMQDIHRNALVSIFLRQLEYFQGILFLTTNRVETFDEAFQSRIHIALRYDKLDMRAKRAVFKMFIDRVKEHGHPEMKPLSDSELNTLAKHDLNGREIKNVVGSAQDLAANRGEPLTIKHINQVLDVHAKFGRDLKGGTGYEDAMRSYF